MFKLKPEAIARFAETLSRSRTMWGDTEDETEALVELYKREYKRRMDSGEPTDQPFHRDALSFGHLEAGDHEWFRHAEGKVFSPLGLDMLFSGAGSYSFMTAALGYDKTAKLRPVNYSLALEVANPGMREVETARKDFEKWTKDEGINKFLGYRDGIVDTVGDRAPWGDGVPQTVSDLVFKSISEHVGDMKENPLPKKLTLWRGVNSSSFERLRKLKKGSQHTETSAMHTAVDPYEAAIYAGISTSTSGRDLSETPGCCYLRVHAPAGTPANLITAGMIGVNQGGATSEIVLPMGSKLEVLQPLRRIKRDGRFVWVIDLAVTGQTDLGTADKVSKFLKSQSNNNALVLGEPRLSHTRRVREYAELLPANAMGFIRESLVLAREHKAWVFAAFLFVVLYVVAIVWIARTLAGDDKNTPETPPTEAPAPAPGVIVVPPSPTEVAFVPSLAASPNKTWFWVVIAALAVLPVVGIVWFRRGARVHPLRPQLPPVVLVAHKKHKSNKVKKIVRV